jgi:hypothetical protein
MTTLYNNQIINMDLIDKVMAKRNSYKGQGDWFFDEIVIKVPKNQVGKLYWYYLFGCYIENGIHSDYSFDDIYNKYDIDIQIKKYQKEKMIREQWLVLRSLSTRDNPTLSHC